MNKVINYFFKSNDSNNNDSSNDDQQPLTNNSNNNLNNYQHNNLNNHQHNNLNNHQHNNLNNHQNKEYTIILLNNKIIELENENKNLKSKLEKITHDKDIEINFLKNDIHKLKQHNNTNNYNNNKNTENIRLKQTVYNLQKQINQLKMTYEASAYHNANNTNINNNTNNENINNSKITIFNTDDYINIIKSISDMNNNELTRIININDLTIFDNCTDNYKLQLTFIYSICKNYYFKYILNETSHKIYGITSNHKPNLEEYFISNINVIAQNKFLKNIECITELYTFFNNYINYCGY